MPVSERRAVTRPLELRRDAGDSAVLSGYAAVFDSYSQNLGGFVEVVDRRAFNSTLGRESRVLALYNHDETMLLGATDARTLRLEADDTGLRYEIDLNMADPDAQRVAAKVERGDMRGSSFGFTADVKGDEWGETEQGYPLRTLRSVRLFDVGPTPSPAYLETADQGLALRSLAAARDIDLPALVAAAEADELRAFLTDPEPGEPASEPPAWQTEIREAQRHLDLLRRPADSPRHHHIPSAAQGAVK